MIAKYIPIVFPFVVWVRGYSLADFRHDLVGGLTVALVLIPQSMAYAQLAGLPAYYGLYAALLPPIIASLFGSSRQLATGPVAVVSLMTATALEPIATAGSANFIAYAILLALLVGIFQFLLGVVRMGLVVNFLSHPVVSGFTNAAAIIIASSQLSKLFGVYVEAGEHHYQTIGNVIVEAWRYTHWTTFLLAVLAFATMIILRRISRHIPNVLVAVVLTAAISWAIGFEQTAKVQVDRIDSAEFRGLVAGFNETLLLINEKALQRVALRARSDSLNHAAALQDPRMLDLEHETRLLNVELDELREKAAGFRVELRRCHFAAIHDSLGRQHFVLRGGIPPGTQCDDRCWRIKIGTGNLDTTALVLSCGGAVVGTIPAGLPAFSLPRIDFSVALDLLPIAMIISLLGFMEAISIARAMAARTGQRIDTNQELIGQGLANIGGAFGQSYAVSGSFSRSAVNIQAGAVSGLSNVFSSLIVVVVLLFLTPLLYHLPQSVLAAIIMMAVVGLLNLKSFFHAWKAQWYDGMIGIVTFVCTLLFAPHLDRGIMIGVVLSLLLYLVRNMKPAIAMLSLAADGTYRNRARFNLGQCPYVAVIRYAGSLMFSNVNYLETRVIEIVRTMPDLRHVLLVGNGINELDASGVDSLSGLIDRLHGQSIRFSVSGLNDAALDVLKRTGLAAKIGENNIYRNASRAVDGIWEQAHLHVTEEHCPLREHKYGAGFPPAG
jgi:MFS superfamily sulfate permease-like transporter